MQDLFRVSAKIACPTCGADEDSSCHDEVGAEIEMHEARRVATVERLYEIRRGPAKLYEWSQPPDYPGCWCIAGEECTIWLQLLPGSDRGRWSATLDAWGRLGASIDQMDAWPRYYMNLTVAKLECLEGMLYREACTRELARRGPPPPDKNPLCIICGVHATPFRMHDFHVLMCTKHGLDLFRRLAVVTIEMLQDYEAAVMSPGKGG